MDTKNNYKMLVGNIKDSKMFRRPSLGSEESKKTV